MKKRLISMTTAILPSEMLSLMTITPPGGNPGGAALRNRSCITPPQNMSSLYGYTA